MANKLFKLVSVAVALSMLLAFGVGMVGAQGIDKTKAPGTWVSSINIQNNGTGTAHVVIDFHKADGSLGMPSYTVTPDLGVGGSTSLYVPDKMSGLPAGEYSVVVSSDQPLEVVANQTSSNPFTAGSYNGIKNASTTLYFPALYKGYFGFNSEVILQNTDAAAADVTLTFYNAAGVAQTPVLANIAGGGYKVFALEDLTGLAVGNGDVAVGNYSLKVTSTKPIAGVGNNWTNAFFGELSDYNGFDDGATTVYAPSISNKYYNFASALIVQNIDTAEADVTITFSNNASRPNLKIGPGKFYQIIAANESDLPSGDANGIFSAKIVSNNGKKLVAVVNSEDKVNGSLATYNGPTAATTTANCPIVLKNYFGFFSATTVMNVGGTAADVTLTYASGASGTEVHNIPAGGSFNFIQNTSSGSKLNDGQAVAATLTSTAQVVAVVQQNSYDRYNGQFGGSKGDYLTAYTCAAK